MESFERAEERFRYRSEKGIVIVCVASAVNYCTIYRIPSGVYTYGSAYLVAFIILFVIFGYPLSFLDIVLGQYYTRGPYNVLKICPLFEGLGSSIVLWCIVTSTYFVFLMAHGMQLMIKSYYDESTMVHCERNYSFNQNTSILNRGLFVFNTQYNGSTLYADYIPSLKLHKNKANPINYTLALCLLLTWLIVFICLASEVHRKQKYVKYSTISVILILGIFFVLYIVKVGFKGCFLYTLFDDRNNIIDPKMWMLVFEHVLFTLGIGTGVFVVFSSYNSFHSMHVRKNVAAINVISFIINIASGIFTLSQAGVIAETSSNSSHVTQQLRIPESPTDIQLLYFDMLNHLPMPQIWMFIVNILLVNVGMVGSTIYLDVMFCTMFDNWTFKKSEKFVYSISCLLLFAVSLGMCIWNPLYFANAIDFYVCNKALFYLEFLILGLLLWIYGFNRLIYDINFMVAKQLTLFDYLKVVWIFTFFALLLLIIVDWTIFYPKDIMEIVSLLFILSPFLLTAFYNTCKYIKHRACNLLLKPILHCGPADQFYRDMRESVLL